MCTFVWVSVCVYICVGECVCAFVWVSVYVYICVGECVCIHLCW